MKRKDAPMITFAYEGLVNLTSIFKPIYFIGKFVEIDRGKGGS